MGAIDCLCTFDGQELFLYTVSDHAEIHAFQNRETRHVIEMIIFVDMKKLDKPENPMVLYTGLVAQVVAPAMAEADLEDLAEQEGTVVSGQVAFHSSKSETGFLVMNVKPV